MSSKSTAAPRPWRSPAAAAMPRRNGSGLLAGGAVCERVQYWRCSASDATPAEMVSVTSTVWVGCEELAKTATALHPRPAAVAHEQPPVAGVPGGVEQCGAHGPVIGVVEPRREPLAQNSAR